MSSSPMTAGPQHEPGPETHQTGTYTPWANEDDPTRSFLPKPSFAADPSSERNSGYAASSPSASNFLLSKTEAAAPDVDAPVRPKQRRKAVWVLIAVAVLVVVIVAVAVPVALIKRKSTSAAAAVGGSQTPNGPSGKGSPGSKNAVWGGDGSTVTTPNGTTFTYNNKLGGICEFFSRSTDPI